MKISIFCTKYIGRGVLNFMLKNHPEDLKAIVYLEQDKDIIQDINIPTSVEIFEYSELENKDSKYFQLELDLVIIAWFPKLVPASYYNFSKLGAINTHNFSPHCY